VHAFLILSSIRKYSDQRKQKFLLVNNSLMIATQNNDCHRLEVSSKRLYSMKGVVYRFGHADNNEARVRRFLGDKNSISSPRNQDYLLNLMSSKDTRLKGDIVQPDPKARKELQREAEEGDLLCSEVGSLKEHRKNLYIVGFDRKNFGKRISTKEFLRRNFYMRTCI
jgi:hypothetical protein